MDTYKDIRFFTTWIRGSWYLIIPDYEVSIQLEEPFNHETLLQIIDNEICQFI